MITISILTDCTIILFYKVRPASSNYWLATNSSNPEFLPFRNNSTWHWPGVSEKISPDQYRLFDEAETDTEAPLEDDEVIIPTHSRKKGGRKKLPAKLPNQPITKSMASPGLLAHITNLQISECITLPLYRQETILRRIGVDIPRATLANWMIKSGTLIQPLINLMRDQMLEYDTIQMDETPVQVLKEPDKRA